MQIDKNSLLLYLEGKFGLNYMARDLLLQQGKKYNVNIRSHFIRLFEKWNEEKTLITLLPRQYANVVLTVIEVQIDRTLCTALMDSGCSWFIISQFVSYKEGRMWTWWLLIGKLISTVGSNSSINLCMYNGDPVKVEIFIVKFNFLFGIKALGGIQINQIRYSIFY